MDVPTLTGINVPKLIFQVHGVDAQGHTVLKKALRREQMSVFFTNLTPCLIGMASCASAHYWGRLLREYGHDVRLMAPQFVKQSTATANQMRGLLAEFGLVLPQGIHHVAARVPELLEQATERLTGPFVGIVPTS